MTAPANGKLSVSIAMCTYNGSRFLPEQLASIAKQTRLPDEMVICDDGSSDSTPEIVEDFARSVPFPVRFVRNAENLGSTKNFEQAIALCTGYLIALSDQDDIWLPEKLARQAGMLEREPSLGGVFTDAEFVEDQSRPIGIRLWSSIFFTPLQQRQFQNGEATSVLLRKNVVTGATLMFRSCLRSLFLPIPKTWYHDGWIAWMLALYSRLALIEDPLIYYRLHQNQQVGVEGVTSSPSLTLKQRLEKGKREEPGRQLSAARELEELERRLIAVNNAQSHAVLPGIRQRIDFCIGRGALYTNRPLNIFWIARNVRNYRQFENGCMCLLRDIVRIYV